MHILVKYASRSRPGRFFEGLHSILDLATDKVGITVFCCLDWDDTSIIQRVDHGRTVKDGFVEAQRVVATKEAHSGQVIYNLDFSKSKIDAINRKVPEGIPWDILVNFSDDMRFTVYGWDELIREGFRCNGDDKFLHYPDSTAKNMLATMSVMDRKYFERDGYIYHPSYQSLWCDNEAMEVAKRRGCYVYMGIQIFEHYHPAYGMVPWDEQYERQQKFWVEDEMNFKYRQSKNFFLDEIKYTHTNDVQ